MNFRAEVCPEDKIRNESVRRGKGIPGNVGENIVERHLTCYGHLRQMVDDKRGCWGKPSERRKFESPRRN
jgi:hypothetical protein